MKTKIEYGIGEQTNLWDRYEELKQKYIDTITTIEMNENLNPFEGS